MIPRPAPEAPSSRRRFLKQSTLLLTSLAAGRSLAGPADAAPGSEPEPVGRIGLLTDLHYADKPPAGSRHYRETPAKLREAVDLYRQEKPDAVIELGDFVDAAPDVDTELGFLRTVNGLFSEIPAPRHYVLGNHCVATLTKKEFLTEIGRTGSFHAADINGWHIVILDACFRGDGEPYGRNNFDWTDTNLPPDQLDWLRTDLAAVNRPTLVFVHQRLDLEPGHHYAIAQCREVRSILERSGVVQAVFQGHSHQNALTSHGGIPYVTLAAMIEGSGPGQNAYAILDLLPEGRLRLHGYHRQEDRSLS